MTKNLSKNTIIIPTKKNLAFGEVRDYIADFERQISFLHRLIIVQSSPSAQMAEAASFKSHAPTNSKQDKRLFFG